MHFRILRQRHVPIALSGAILAMPVCYTLLISRDHSEEQLLPGNLRGYGAVRARE